MAQHVFRVIESCNEFGRNGEPRYFAVCLDGTLENGACYVSRTQTTARMAFTMGHVHQQDARGIPNILAKSPKYRGISWR